MTTQIGYARVSKADGSQVHDLQRDALVAVGVDPDHIYEDAASGRRDTRPGLDACLKALDFGVRRTHIIDGRVPHSLLLEIFTDKGMGTLVSHDVPEGVEGV